MTTFPQNKTQDKWGKTTGDVLNELLKDFLEREGIERFATFHGTGEGQEFPTGLASESFKLLAPDGRIWFIFLGWDSEKTAPDGSTGYYDLDIEPVTAEWFKTTYGGELVDNPEYQRAKQQLGLD